LLISLHSQPPIPVTSPLSLHDALPICFDPGLFEQFGFDVDGALCGQRQRHRVRGTCGDRLAVVRVQFGQEDLTELHTNDGKSISDRKSTRLNSSHVSISYAVFCLKKKK